MKKIFFLVLILGLIIVAWGQSLNCPKNKVIEAQKTKKCSSIVEGLQFCTTSTFVSIKSGEKVTINVSIQNMTDKTISIANGNLSDFYNVVVTDLSGDKIPSFTEKLKKEVDEGKIPLEDLIRALPINSSPQKVILVPQQELKIEFNLSDFYDLKTKGKYQIEISRKIPKQNGLGNTEISFGAIEIEVK